MDDAILSELRGVFEQVFGRAMPDLGRTTRPTQIDGWNSLRHANLVMTIEERFGIEVPEERYADFEDVGDLADLVVALKGS